MTPVEEPGNGEPLRLILHDTFTRSLRPLVPSDGGALRFYCCGPTVYGPAHIGNFRSFVLQDVFRRVVESTGLATRHVRNITDVDDKTIRQSQEAGESLADFTDKWAAAFREDCGKLGILPPHVEPSAVENIPEQIALIEKLVRGGFAYQSGDGSVYFRVQSFPAYGMLSRLQERTITTGTDSDGAHLEDEYERDSAADFALWKARRPGDGPNFWDSPWGEGRPGWHIECSAMSMKHLGPTFDLHGGGVDLIFPHHENEIAQSEAATGQKFVHHWFHVAHLLVDGTKMSKSLGNLFTLEDIEARGFSPEDLRYLLLSGSYRQPLNFTWESLQAAQKALARLREFRRRLGEGQGEPAVGFGVFQPVQDALLDDLNTPEALGRLFGIIRKLTPDLESGSIEEKDRLQWLGSFLLVLQAFGFQLTEKQSAEAPPEIQALAARRWEAKQTRDWAAADALRAELTEVGWEVRDGPQGYELAPLSPS